MKREYRPYEEWWQEEVPCVEFFQDINSRVHSFYNNMVNLNNAGEKSRQEWMETFILWLEYESKE